MVDAQLHKKNYKQSTVLVNVLLTEYRAILGAYSLIIHPNTQLNTKYPAT